MSGKSVENSPSSSSKEAAAASELQPIARSNSSEANENENETNFGDIVQNFAEDTSLPGLPRVILARSRLSRYFWLFICLTCAISFGVGIFQLLQRYFSYQKKVTVEMVSDPVPFPHVTLCNMRSLDFEVLNTINDLFLEDPTILKFVDKPTGKQFVDAYIKFVAKFSRLWYANGTGDNPKTAAALNEAISRISLYDEIPNEAIIEAGIQLEQYVARCTFAGVPCNYTRDFIQFFNQYYFNCYTYDPAAATAHTLKENGDRQLPWLSPGLDNGLSIVVLTGSGMLKRNELANLIPGIYDMGSAISGNDGVRVVIHSPGVVPFPLAEGFDVPPGFSVSFGVRPRRNARIGPPHGDCVSSNPFDKETKAKVRPYRQMVCQKQCIQQFVKAECECYDETLLRPPSDYEDDEDDFDMTAMCHATDHFPSNCVDEAAPECLEALLLQYDRVHCSKKIRDQVRASPNMMSQCGCRSSCDELVYDVSYSISRWPAAGYEGDAVYNELLLSPAGSMFIDRFKPWPAKYDIMNEYFNESKVNRIEALRDFARINVYIADPEVIVTTESEDYDVSQLVSDIGGQLGVWIGLSVITAAEVVELIIIIAGRCTKGKRQRRRQQSTKDTAADHC